MEGDQVVPIGCRRDARTRPGFHPERGISATRLGRVDPQMALPILERRYELAARQDGHARTGPGKHAAAGVRAFPPQRVVGPESAGVGLETDQDFAGRWGWRRWGFAAAASRTAAARPSWFRDQDALDPRRFGFAEVFNVGPCEFASFADTWGEFDGQGHPRASFAASMRSSARYRPPDAESGRFAICVYGNRVIAGSFLLFAHTVRPNGFFPADVLFFVR